MICSKCKDDKSSQEFCFKNKKLGIKSSVCKVCQREYKKKYYYGNKSSHYARNQIKTAKLKIIVSKAKDIGCKYCPEKEKCCLDFHHTRDKKFLVSALVKKGSLSKLMTEMDKCEIVCANCHRKIHAGLL